MDALKEAMIRAEDRDLPEPCSQCGATSPEDVKYLCTSFNRAALDGGEPCHGESPR